MVMGKNIRAQVAPSDCVSGHLLDNRPPIGLQQDSVPQPITDKLLTGLGSTGLPQASGKLGLVSTGEVDRSPQSNNVTRLHGHPKYTNRFVLATTPFVCHENKEACTVLVMPITAKKPIVRPPIAAPKTRPKKRQARPGTDGRTLGDRLAMAMAHETGRRGREYRQADLLADVNHLAQAPEDDPALTQQMLSAIMRNQVTRSSYTAFMAVACHVNPLWLSDGIGNMTP